MGLGILNQSHIALQHQLEKNSVFYDVTWWRRQFCNWACISCSGWHDNQKLDESSFSVGRVRRPQRTPTENSWGHNNGFWGNICFRMLSGPRPISHFYAVSECPNRDYFNLYCSKAWPKIPDKRSIFSDHYGKKQ